MKEQDTTITIRVSKQWLAKLDKWRECHEFTPSRSDVIRFSIEKLIASDKGKAK
jgi:Arc/MetJ-type ribon-helix-helix transcriptional regulator